MDPEIQKLLDQHSANYVRIQAELTVLRRFVAQLYDNCSRSREKRVEVFRLMDLAADQLEQKMMEDLEATHPAAAARIDEARPGSDSADVLPPVW